MVRHTLQQILQPKQKITSYILISILSAICAFARTSTLSQIQDTVMTPSGTPFNGMVVITWTGTTSTSGTAPFNTSVRISNGVLSVLLAPSTDITPVAYYQAVYNSSDGLTTWTENWAVPPSATPLTLSQVRVTNTSGSGGTGGGGTGSQIAISQVTGLTSDLNAINSSLSTFNSIVDGLNLLIGNLTNTVNSLGNTVANLTAGATTANFVDDETPGGAINGTNTIFTLANTPAVPVNLTLYRNGILQTSGVDYTLSGTTITFSGNEAPQSGDALLAYYRIPGTGTASTFVDNETPAGIIDGNNVGFSLAYIPCPAISLRLFKNGALLQENVDYTLSGQMITFANSTVAPAVGDSLTAYYRIMSQNLSTSVSRGESAPVRQDR